MRNIYAVNRDHVEATVELLLGESACSLTDVVTTEVIEGDVARFRLGPYELRSFTCACSEPPVSVRVSIAEEARLSLNREAEVALRALAHARESGRAIPGASAIERDIITALADGRSAWLRRAITSYPVLAALEALGAAE